MMRVVLVEPQIAPNTGNIGRLCVAAGCELVIAGRPGFSLTEKAVRRAGLDYWKDVRLRRAANLEEAIAGVPRESLYFFTARAERCFWDAHFGPGAVLVFGNENPGLPTDVSARFADRAFRIPMSGPTRSLNLAVAVAIVVYEALRQQRPTGSQP